MTSRPTRAPKGRCARIIRPPLNIAGVGFSSVVIAGAGFSSVVAVQVLMLAAGDGVRVTVRPRIADVLGADVVVVTRILARMHASARRGVVGIAVVGACRGAANDAVALPR